MALSPRIRKKAVLDYEIPTNPDRGSKWFGRTAFEEVPFFCCWLREWYGRKWKWGEVAVAVWSCG
jgi:hypothetical protein